MKKSNTTTHEDMFKFLHERNDRVRNVLDVSVKVDDDNYGSAGEHYIVKCEMVIPDYNLPLNNLIGREDAVCLVDAQEFLKWRDKKDSVIWI